MAFLGTSAAILLVLPAIKLVYYLQMYLFLACAAGALEAKRCCEAFCERGRYLALGALVSTAFLPHMPIHLYWLIRGDYKEARQEISALLLAAGNESVVAVSPAHPIFVHDLTYLSHGHQWNHCMGAPGVRERLSGMSRQVIQARPLWS